MLCPKAKVVVCPEMVRTMDARGRLKHQSQAPFRNSIEVEHSSCEEEEQLRASCE